MKKIRILLLTRLLLLFSAAALLLIGCSDAANEAETQPPPGVIAWADECLFFIVNRLSETGENKTQDELRNESYLAKRCEKITVDHDGRIIHKLSCYPILCKDEVVGIINVDDSDKTDIRYQLSALMVDEFTEFYRGSINDFLYIEYAGRQFIATKDGEHILYQKYDHIEELEDPKKIQNIVVALKNKLPLLDESKYAAVDLTPIVKLNPPTETYSPTVTH